MNKSWAKERLLTSYDMGALDLADVYAWGLLGDVSGRTVVDFGCGGGAQYHRQSSRSLGQRAGGILRLRPAAILLAPTLRVEQRVGDRYPSPRGQAFPQVLPHVCQVPVQGHVWALFFFRQDATTSRVKDGSFILGLRRFDRLYLRPVPSPDPDLGEVFPTAHPGR